MRILFLTFYYPPDLCAGSFRAQPLAEALLKEGAGRVSVDILTTMPNRYHSHVQKAPAFEESNGLTICRIPLPNHQSGMADQARAFLIFARAVRRQTKGGRWDLILATSSRLMTAALGAHVARVSGAPLYLDIRDLFTDTLGGLLAGSPLRMLMPAFHWIERRTFASAACINVVSPGFVEHVRGVAPRQNCRTFTNGIDEDFFRVDFTRTEPAPGGPRLVVYAGNMGDSQGLHRILPRAAADLVGEVRFRLIGDGGRRRELEKALRQQGCTNVEVLDPVPRGELYRHYREADILFTHLNDVPAFEKVLPSKIFEYGATGKPILAGVRGLAAKFLRENVTGSEIFPPCDAKGFVEAVRRLRTAPSAFDRSAFRQRFSRKNIMRKMALDILAQARV